MDIKIIKVSGRTEDIDNAIGKAKTDGLSRDEYLEVAAYLERVSISMQLPNTSARKTQINEAKNAAFRKAEALTVAPVIKKH